MWGWGVWGSGGLGCGDGGVGCGDGGCGGVAVWGCKGVGVWGCGGLGVWGSWGLGVWGSGAGDWGGKKNSTEKSKQTLTTRSADHLYGWVGEGKRPKGQELNSMERKSGRNAQKSR